MPIAALLPAPSASATERGMSTTSPPANTGADVLSPRASTSTSPHVVSDLVGQEGQVAVLTDRGQHRIGVHGEHIALDRNGLRRPALVGLAELHALAR